MRTKGSPARVALNVPLTHVGTAAWSNPPAERSQRPESASHLAHYATRFNAVEINSSFYRSHRRSTYQSWSEATPEEFRFAVKMPRTVTHESGLHRCRAELTQFLREVAGLGDKLGVILVQTPASLPFNATVATRFFVQLKTSTTGRVACEPRHPSWFTSEANALLRKHGVARVAADPPRIPEAALPAGAKRLVYYRLHGSPRMYYSAYSAEYLQALAMAVRTPKSQTRDVWCIFDNTARHASWDNARDLRRLIDTGSAAQLPGSPPGATD